jgi:two-component system, NtrC family, sensor kinase
MKPFKIFLFLLFCGINFCKAQDSAVVLSTSMFDKTTERILLAEKDGWIFKQGNDTVWAKQNIDITGWKKLKPTEISAKLADKNGRAEGWFRIKIKPDSSFTNIPVAFNSGSWAAVDIYVDGKQISAYGNTGVNGKPFEEHRHTFDPPVTFNLTPAKDHIIAIHFVDYVAPLPPRRLKSEDASLQYFISLTTPKSISLGIKNIIQAFTYSTIWVAVCFILSILFWLLYFQNRNEKNLRLIAFCATCFALGMYFLARENAEGISYDSYTVYNIGAALFVETALIIIPFLLAKIFKRKISRPLKFFLVIILIAFISDFFVSTTTGNILIGISVLSIIVICLYYIISSWKKLKGAQWAIVTGLLLSLFFILLFFFITVVYKNIPFQYFLLFLTGFSLSFPLSLLVYVAMRFKGYIKEVEQNAKRVVQLSEEKKEHAINQQKILQEEVNRQTSEIRTTLDNLKSTQSQLIQSEKMASLGELTAGIAHEIQNPLNFVNNFSEVNKEMLEELKAERIKPNAERDDALQDELINDVIDNSEKINHHGKRADAIVKGMLQHSRQSSGQKEPTDINALADEYLRLSYHGLRAKDKTFNAEIKTDFDGSIGKVNIIPQDVGRVILNLFNNAFYAVTQKKKLNIPGYEPTVSVTTKKIDGHISIHIKDNGNGIPQNIVDKIFQPFFTTKPTGEGTGLGLSLAYDIIKAHGGELKVESKEGEGSEFVVQLPVV